jgi:hypothetical protein
MIFFELFSNKNSSYSEFSDILFKNGNIKTLVVAFFVLILNIAVHISIDYFSDSVFLIYIILINTILAFCHINSNLGIIPCARYILIVSPGFLQYLIYFFTDDNIRIAFLANDYLNVSIFKNVASISNIAATSSLIGFCFKPIENNINLNNFLKKYYIPYKQIFFLLFVFFAVTYALTIGESMLTSGSYGNSESGESTVKIGTLNVFYFYFVSIFFIISSIELKLSKTASIIYSSIFYLTIIFIALRGVRQDSLGVPLSLLTVVYFLRNKNVNKYYTLFFLFIFAWIGSIITGIIRADFSLQTLSSIFVIFTSTFFKNMQGYLALNLDTASMTVGTLNVIPYKIEELGYLWGSSYLDWIPRTLPSFVYENRPVDLAFQMHYNGDWFGWGGVHEVAEAYWNFGIFGVVVIPFIISLVLNLLGTKFINSKSLYSAIPLVWLIMLPRYVWYQSFGFYKSTIVLCFLVFLIKITRKYLMGFNKPNKY